MCHLASSVQQSCHCFAIYCYLFLIGPSNQPGPRFGFRNLECVFLLAIFLPPTFVTLDILGECPGAMELFMHSLPETVPCLLAWDSSS